MKEVKKEKVAEEILAMKEKLIHLTVLAILAARRERKKIIEKS